MAGPRPVRTRWGRSQSGSHRLAPIFGHGLILDGASLRAPKPSRTKVGNLTGYYYCRGRDAHY